MGDEGYIVEFTTVGNSVKATAVDTVTLLEVSVMGSKRTTKEQLAELAIRKLLYMLAKKGGS